MHEILTSIKAYLYDRAASPLLGALLASWTVWNYRFFVVLLSPGLSVPSAKFAEIDALFHVRNFEFLGLGFQVSGRIIDGMLVPALIAVVYLYLYPFVAKPVYEHGLKKQRELRAIKQAQDDERLLTAEESRGLYRQLAQLQSKHQEEIDRFNSQIVALNRIIEETDKEESARAEKENGETESARPALEDELEGFDSHIRDAIESRRMGSFQLNELFGQKKWLEIPAVVRQALGKRLLAQVQRGDYVGVTTIGKGSGNQQQYFKSN